jgi:hypothetical protein
LISYRVDAVFWSPIGKELSLSPEEPGLDPEEESDLNINPRLVVIGA